MAMHFLNKRCGECDRIYSVRRPKNPNQVAAVVALVQCPYCHPEALKDVCGACRLPSSIYPIHSNGVCGACARWQFYLRLNDEKRGAIRVQETKRWRAGSLQRVYRDITSEGLLRQSSFKGLAKRE